MFTAFAAAAVAIFVMPPAAEAAVPTTVMVDGVLFSAGGGPAADGVYDLTFGLYEKKVGAAPLWAEGPLKVTVTNGRFRQVLGASKPLTNQVLLKLDPGYLGVIVSPNIILPLVPLHSVVYALRAKHAAGLDCTGCVAASHIKAGTISADKIGFTYAGAKTKGGPADKALDLACTGCDSVSEISWDGDVDLGRNRLKAKKIATEALTAKTVAATTVSATSFVGDGSKLTGIKVPAGTCTAKGTVVKGIAPDGKLICVPALDPSALPPDALDEVSNNLLTNQFVDVAKLAKPMAIKDNDPTGVGAEINVPDYGIAQKISFHVEIDNSDISKLEVILYDPDNKKYPLYKGSKTGKLLKGTWPVPDKTLSGDLTTWYGKNPKGKWRLRIIDTGFKNNGVDGQLKVWTISIQTLSNKKVAADGLLQTRAGLQLQNATKHPVTCGPDTSGYVYFNTSVKVMYVCNGKDFFPIKLSLPGTQENPAVTCKEVATLVVGAKSGAYWIDPDGQGGLSPFSVYCDMATSGGGWTRVEETTNFPYQKYSESDSTKPYKYKLNKAQIDAIKSKSTEGRQAWSCHTVGVHRASYQDNWVVFWDGSKGQFAQCQDPGNSKELKASGTWTTLKQLPMASWHPQDCGDSSEKCQHQADHAWFR